jgi:hypothetical protein
MTFRRGSRRGAVVGWEPTGASRRFPRKLAGDFGGHRATDLEAAARGRGTRRRWRRSPGRAGAVAARERAFGARLAEARDDLARRAVRSAPAAIVLFVTVAMTVAWRGDTVGHARDRRRSRFDDLPVQRTAPPHSATTSSRWSRWRLARAAREGVPCDGVRRRSCRVAMLAVGILFRCAAIDRSTGRG